MIIRALDKQHLHALHQIVKENNLDQTLKISQSFFINNSDKRNREEHTRVLEEIKKLVQA